MKTTPVPKLLPPSDKNISRQLQRMLNSPGFHASPQQVAFLEFVVNKTLTGKAAEIKGYSVATEVFGRGPDFDQSVDPVVSIQASRLRRALERYYLTAGKHDPIRIIIPRGTYVPKFIEQFPSEKKIAAVAPPSVSDAKTWPTLLVRPLANLTNNPEEDYLSMGLATELAHALGHYKEIRILEAAVRNLEPLPRETENDFVLDGNIRRDPAGIRVAIKLCSIKNCVRIWSGKYKGDFEAAKMISFQEKVAAEVAVRVAGDNAAIPRHLLRLSQSKSATELTTYEAMLRFWQSETLPSRQSVLQAIRALEHAVDREPDYGQTWSMLAAKYAYNYGFEIIDQPTSLEKAAAYARKGVNLDPTNRRTRMILGYVHLMQNKLREARREAEAAYNLCPNSLIVLDGIGWLMTLAGEWELGVRHIKKAIKLNPYCSPRVRYALCLNWLRLEDYEKAYQQALQFMMPEFYWDPLLRASVCGHLARIEEGRASVRSLLALKPDFGQRGRILIGRYVKFERIADRILEGLEILGMRVD